MLVEQNNKVHTHLWKIAPHVVELKSSIIRDILKIPELRRRIFRFAKNIARAVVESS